MDKITQFHEWLKAEVSEAKELYDWALDTDKETKPYRERWAFTAIILDKFEEIMGVEK